MEFKFLKSKSNLTKKDLPLTTTLHSSAIDENTYSNPDAIFTLDIDGNVIELNNSPKELFGYTDYEIINILSDHFKPNTQNSGTKYLEQALNGEIQNFRTEILHKNGYSIEVTLTLIPILNSQKQITVIQGFIRNVSDNNNKELMKLKEHFESAQLVANIGSWEYDLIKNESYWSLQKYKIYGISPNNFVPTLENVIDFIHPEDREKFKQTIINAVKKIQDFRLECRIIKKDGSVVYVIEQGSVVYNESNQPISFLGTIQDITPRKIAEMKLLESEQRFKNIYNNLEVGIWSYDVQKNTFLLSSPGILSVTGYTFKEIPDYSSFLSKVLPEDQHILLNSKDMVISGIPFNGTYRILHKNGEIRWVHDQTLPVLDSNNVLIRLDGIITDITDLKKSEDMIKHLAYHDYLTELPNRRMFDEKIHELADNASNSFSIINFDLDRFKTINDTLGNRIGDHILKQFGNRISKIFNQASVADYSFLLARLGSDEFGLIIWGYSPLNFPIQIAKKVLAELKNPFIVDQYELYVTTSMGISSFPKDGDTVEEVLKNAETALYRAKENGKNNYHLYSASLNIQSFKLYTMERDLRKSIQNGELRVYFQPKVETSTGKIVGAEALIRWEHPVWGLISPNEFIPLAEENGFILEIGDWVLKQVCTYLNEWEQSGLPIVPISINKSAKRFLISDWTSVIYNTLKETNTDPSLIEFEITETTLLQHNDTVNNAIDFLKEIGIKIALDDFGTGYSSFTYLKQYPINTIKIDQSFIRNISNHSDEMIIKSTIYLAKGLGMKVVAEGVETKEQLTFLKQLNCDEIQGYLFSKPVPEKEFQHLLQMAIIKPTGDNTYVKPTVNRRKYYRINLTYPLSSQMSLESIKGKNIELGTTEVLIENIGLGGIKFLTTLNMPVRPDIILRFKTTLLDTEFQFSGKIVWKQELHDIYQYGVEYDIADTDRKNLSALLNKFSVQLKTNPLLANSSFIQKDKITYLKKNSFH